MKRIQGITLEDTPTTLRKLYLPNNMKQEFEEGGFDEGTMNSILQKTTDFSSSLQGKKRKN